MTKESSKKKGIGWFKSMNSNPFPSEQGNLEEETPVTNLAQEDKVDTQNSNTLFSKDNQDKITLDLVVSLENMLKDRELILYRNRGLGDQLDAANEMVARLKQDQVKKEQILQEKNKAVRTLESSLTSKQMSYDQLLEDYKDYQSTSHMEYNQVLNQLETETNKYNKLNEESMNIQYKNMLKINELEESIRNLEIDNQQHIQQQQKILAEKSELMQTINDFTERMSFSFSPKATTPGSSDSK